MTGIKYDENKIDFSLVDFTVIYGDKWVSCLDTNASFLLGMSDSPSPWVRGFCQRLAALASTEGFPARHVWALEQFVHVMNAGAKKYSAYNWQHVRPISRYYSALIRHDLAAARFGADAINDDDFGLPHLAHSMWNCYALAWFERAGVKW